MKTIFALFAFQTASYGFLPIRMSSIIGPSERLYSEYALKEGNEMTIRFKIWVEEDGTTLFGHGLEELLKGIDEYRSLFGAARKLKMSYRAAWGKIKEAEKRTGTKFVITSGHKGMILTEDAKKFMKEFEALEEMINDYLKKNSESFKITEQMDAASESDSSSHANPTPQSSLHMPSRAYA